MWVFFVETVVVMKNTKFLLKIINVYETLMSCE
ncbi:Uncharacterised protein [Serratia quinivorans]|nr:Uncharacterised protein [Serratia quinivorans]